MSIRLQVLLDEAEIQEIREIARRRHVTVSEWVRQVLRRARRDEPRIAADRKLAAIEAAARHAFATADIDVMNAEIERGYLGETNP
jgi:hypothetical protein